MLLLLVPLVGLIAYGLYLRYSRAGRLFAKIPGPWGLPILGNSLELMLTSDPIDLFNYLRWQHRTYGDICKLGGLSIRAVNIFNPQDVETIASTTRYNEKGEPYTFLRPWLCEGLLISNGDKWRQRRKLLTPAFHFNILKQFSRTFSEQTEEFLARIKQEVGKNETEVVPLITAATLNIMCESSMGTSMHEGIQTIAKQYFKAIHLVGESTVYRICRIHLFFDEIFQYTKVAKILKEAVYNLHEFTNKIIQERRLFREQNGLTNVMDFDDVYGKKSRYALLDLLLENEKEGKIDGEGIREEVDTFMFEGHDTTAMALSFMIMRIANESKVQDRIYEEMVEIFGDSTRPPTVDDLNEMKYLDMCIKESLRLYPSVPFIARYATEDVVLSGYTVPKDTLLHINVYDIHRREDIYPDPEEFIPERFLPENTAKRHPYAYIPFSAGPRNCIGQKFAILEMKTVMSGLIRKFRLEPITKPHNIIFYVDLVLRARNPIYVRFCTRERITMQ